MEKKICQGTDTPVWRLSILFSFSNQIPSHWTSSVICLFQTAIQNNWRVKYVNFHWCFRSSFPFCFPSALFFPICEACASSVLTISVQLHHKASWKAVFKNGFQNVLWGVGVDDLLRSLPDILWIEAQPASLMVYNKQKKPAQLTMKKSLSLWCPSSL